MVEYIYFVKCPNCEDEHFDFFDEAKAFALGCLSKKPVITQTEVCRNDFGECTDHSDLGTIWSWEDMMNDENMLEPEASVFSKDNLKDYDPDNDPEFQDDDFFAINSEEPVVDDLDEAANVSFNNKADYKEFVDLTSEIGIMSGEDLDRFMKEVEADDSNLLDKLRNYKAELGDDFEIKEAMSDFQAKLISRLPTMTKVEFQKKLESGEHITIFTGDPRESGIRNRTYEATYEDGKYEVSCWDETYNDDFTDSEVVEEFDNIDNLWTYIVEFMEDDDFSPEYNYLAEACERKPIPEGMTIDQLKEAMEENEDTVECAGCEELFPKDECFHKEGIGYLCGNCEDRIVRCTWCDDLYDKSECRKEVDLGWLCSRCESAIKSRGETLTFREGSYWDDLDEDIDLNEAWYFRHITNEVAETAKQEIIDKLTYPRTNGRFNISWDNSFHNRETIIDFSILDTMVDIVIERVHTDAYTKEVSTSIRTLEFSIAAAQARAGRPRARDFLRDLRTAVEAVNKEHNIGVAARRDNAVQAQLTPDIAEELKQHITKIRFRIPLVDEIMDLEDSNGEALSAAAENKLNSIYSNFFNNAFAEDAREAGMVDNRLPSEDTNRNIASSWKPIGKITFDCRVEDLSDEAREVIRLSRPTSDKDVSAMREIDCVRLAIALIRYYNNDVRFYEAPVVEEVVEEDYFNAF